MKYCLLFIYFIYVTEQYGVVEGVKGPGAVVLRAAECKRNCDIKTPNCFYPDYKDCRFYKNCYLESGKWKGYLRPCPYGQFWSTKWNSCDYYYNVKCKADRCRTTSISDYTNQHKLTFQKCNRNYWACTKGRSEPRCCHEGEVYEPGRGCVPSDCIGKCLLSLNDICKYEASGFKFGQNNKNCRKHLQCKNKIAISACCPAYHRFEYGKCVPDLKCDKPCPTKSKKLPPRKHRPVVCHVYKVQPECPVGEMWGKRYDGCPGCIRDPTIKRLTAACKKDILYVHLDFKEKKLPWYNLPNKAPTVTKIWAGGKNLKRKKDAVLFGKGHKPTYISFPWYHNNIEARFKIYVEFRFKTDNSGKDLQTLLSDCYSRGGGPSFAILKTSKNPKNKLTIFAQTEVDSASFSLSYVPNKWNVLRVSYNGFVLRASLSVPSSTYVNEARLRGKLRVALHPLKFGTCMSRGKKPFDQFHGLLDYIKIWGCKTGWNTW